MDDGDSIAVLGVAKSRILAYNGRQLLMVGDHTQEQKKGEERFSALDQCSLVWFLFLLDLNCAAI